MEQPCNRLVIFNYAGLIKESKRLNLDPISMLRVIFFKANTQQEQYKKCSVRLDTVLRGDNFLINPLGLIESNCDLAYKLMYLELVGLRSYSHYKVTKELYIQLDLWPDLKLDLARLNPLVKVEGDFALFLLPEEAESTIKK